MPRRKVSYRPRRYMVLRKTARNITHNRDAHLSGIAPHQNENMSSSGSSNVPTQPYAAGNLIFLPEHSDAVIINRNLLKKIHSRRRKERQRMKKMQPTDSDVKPNIKKIKLATLTKPPINKHLIILSDSEDEESKKCDDTTSKPSKNLEEESQTEKGKLNESVDDDVIFVEQKTQNEIIDLEDTNSDQSDKGKATNENEKQNERSEMVTTPDSSASNDFLDNSLSQQQSTKFNFSLHGSEFKDSEFLKPTIVADVSESGSVSTISDISTNIRANVFNVIDFPREKENLFDDNNMDKFKNSITPQRTEKRADEELSSDATQKNLPVLSDIETSQDDSRRERGKSIIKELVNDRAYALLAQKKTKNKKRKSLSDSLIPNELNENDPNESTKKKKKKKSKTEEEEAYVSMFENADNVATSSPLVDKRNKKRKEVTEDKNEIIDEDAQVRIMVRCDLFPSLELETSTSNKKNKKKKRSESEETVVENDEKEKKKKKEDKKKDKSHNEDSTMEQDTSTDQNKSKPKKRKKELEDPENGQIPTTNQSCDANDGDRDRRKRKKEKSVSENDHSEIEDTKNDDKKAKKKSVLETDQAENQEIRIEEKKIKKRDKSISENNQTENEEMRNDERKMKKKDKIVPESIQVGSEETRDDEKKARKKQLSETENKDLSEKEVVKSNSAAVIGDNHSTSMVEEILKINVTSTDLSINENEVPIKSVENETNELPEIEQADCMLSTKSSELPSCTQSETSTLETVVKTENSVEVDETSTSSELRKEVTADNNQNSDAVPSVAVSNETTKNADNVITDNTPIVEQSPLIVNVKIENEERHTVETPLLPDTSTVVKTEPTEDSLPTSIQEIFKETNNANSMRKLCEFLEEVSNPQDILKKVSMIKKAFASTSRVEVQIDENEPQPNDDILSISSDGSSVLIVEDEMEAIDLEDDIVLGNCQFGEPVVPHINVSSCPNLENEKSTDKENVNQIPSLLDLKVLPPSKETDDGNAVTSSDSIFTMDTIFESNTSNSDLNCVLQNMSDDPKLWSISPSDLPLNNKQNRSKRCVKCGEFGHVSRHCKNDRKRPKCLFCGKDHLDARCPNKICLQCGRKAPVVRHGCAHCQHHKTTLCSICKLRGHPRRYCPDLWRRYHLTVEEGPLVQAPRGTKLKEKNRLWCSMCGKQGHLDFYCYYALQIPAFRSLDIKIHNYEDLYHNVNETTGTGIEHDEPPNMSYSSIRNISQENNPPIIPPVYSNMNESCLEKDINKSYQGIESLPQEFVVVDEITEQSSSSANPNLSSSSNHQVNIEGDSGKANPTAPRNKDLEFFFMNASAHSLRGFLNRELNLLSKSFNVKSYWRKIRFYEEDERRPAHLKQIKRTSRTKFYKTLNMYFFGVEKLKAGPFHLKRLKNFVSDNAYDMIREKRRDALISYDYIFRDWMHEHTNYHVTLKRLCRKYNLSKTKGTPS